MSEITPDKPASRLPADYYSSPPSQQRMVPRGLTFGCGAVALLILVLMFAGGAFVNGGGGTRLVRGFFTRIQTELLQQCGKDVKPQQKTAFAAEYSAMQDRITAGKVKSDDLLDVFKSIRDDSEDGVVTSAELEQLTGKIHAINSAR